MPSVLLAMLLAVCACAALAAVRASGTNQPPVYKDVFSVNGVQTDLINGLRTPFNHWYDGKNVSYRLDVYNHTVQTALVNYPDEKAVSMTVSPNTTETELNQMACEIIYVKGRWLMPSVLPYIGRESTFIGTELCHGKEAFHWRTTIEDAITIDSWVTYRNGSGGDPVAVPLRSKYKMINWNGYIINHSVTEYFDFKVYDGGLDPEIFNISKGLSCKEIHEAQDSSIMEHTRLVMLPWSYDSNEFDLYKTIHNKHYASRDEYEMRWNIYRKNVELIEQHNRGNHSYRLAVNQFTDRTEQELRTMMGYKAAGRSSAALEFPHSKAEVEELSKDLPEKFDWRLTPGVVKRVKEQSWCQGDYAFAAVGAIEGVNAIVNGSYRPRLSEQALIDCSWGFQNYGCGGGSVVGAFEYVKKHGIPTYGAYGGYVCLNDFCRVGDMTDLIRISDFYAVTPNDTNALKLALFKYGPVAVSIELNTDFVFYSYGVYDHPGCGTRNVPRHAVLVVGWGELDGQKYWIVKNSWGNRWGNNGYALVAMDNDCGLTSMPYYVTIDKHVD